MMTFALAILVSHAPVRPFGYHVAEVAIKGDYVRSATAILKSCGMRVSSARVTNRKDEVSKAIDQSDNVIVAYRYKGWTHFFDPSYALIGDEKVWLDLSKRHKTRILAWCCEETTSAYVFSLYDGGHVLRTVNVVDGEVEQKGKPLTQEGGLRWKDVSAEGILDLTERLGAPMRLEEKGTPYTLLSIEP